MTTIAFDTLELVDKLKLEVILGEIHHVKK